MAQVAGAPPAATSSEVSRTSGARECLPHKDADYYDSGLDEVTQIKENGTSCPQAPFAANQISKNKLEATAKSPPSSPVQRGKEILLKSCSENHHRLASSKTIHTERSHTTSEGSSEEKKVPMNKIQVGIAPSPNLKAIKSKVGSLDYAAYKPGGGAVKIESQKLRWSAKSKVGSLEKTSYKPGGGDKKIQTQKLDFSRNAQPKVGSTANVSYKPGGGAVKIENRKLELKAQSKVGSLDYIKHRPGGGEKKVFDDLEYRKQAEGCKTPSGKGEEEEEEAGTPEKEDPKKEKDPEEEAGSTRIGR